MLALLMMREQEVRHVEKRSEFGQENNHCHENMKKLTTNTQSGLDKGEGLHTQCDKRGKAFYHDKKWKYKKKSESDKSNKDKVHRGMDAEDIDFWKRNSKRDSNNL
eukprot:6950298-Heterocapsa_arctica.AAC.1